MEKLVKKLTRLNNVIRRFWLDARIPRDLSLDLSSGKDRILYYNGFEFLIHKNDHLPPHVHVKKSGVKSTFCIEEKDRDEDNNHFSRHEASFVRKVIKQYKASFLKKWRVQNPVVADPRSAQAERIRKQSKKSRRDVFSLRMKSFLARIGVRVMPVDNSYHDLHDYPRIRKWRRFDDINTVAVEFADGVLRLYPMKINEIHHNHIGYGGYQQQCGKMFTTIKLVRRKYRDWGYYNDKRMHFFVKDWYFRFKNRITIHLGYIYYYGISFDGFLSIDELTRDDVIRIASAEGLDLLSPPSYGPGGMTYKDYIMYNLQSDREYKAWVKAGRPQPDENDD